MKGAKLNSREVLEHQIEKSGPSECSLSEASLGTSCGLSFEFSRKLFRTPPLLRRARCCSKVEKTPNKAPLPPVPERLRNPTREGSNIIFWSEKPLVFPHVPWCADQGFHDSNPCNVHQPRRVKFVRHQKNPPV